MQIAARLFNRIARSHMYWGRKPLVGLLHVFEDAGGGFVLDPFCGAGTPAIAALIRGSRVVATDLNPMAGFLTRVLARPLAIPLLLDVFQKVVSSIEGQVHNAYAMKCPKCKMPAIADFIVWEGAPEDGVPVAAKVRCRACDRVPIETLSSIDRARQKKFSRLQSLPWQPQNQIHTISRHPPVPTHDRLFTPRNFFLLKSLLSAIDKLESVPYREALQYVFTASLYSCSQMQMFSQKDASSSRGWTALRFYIPPRRKETNVLHAFARRFESFLSCKELLNAALPTVQVTDCIQSFKGGDANILVRQMPWADSLREFGSLATHVFLDPPYNDDVDYFGFSEFWGNWLDMQFPFEMEWHPRRKEVSATGELLRCVAKWTPRKCCVALALTPSHPGEEKAENAIRESGYRTAASGCFLYDNSYKRGENLMRRRERYYLLDREARSRPAESRAVDGENGAASNAEAYPYVRAMAHLLVRDSPGAEMLRARAINDILPSQLRHLSDKLKGPEIRAECDDGDKNRRTYQSLCLALAALLLQRDGWTLYQINKSEVEKGVFGLPEPATDRRPAQSAAAIFASEDGNRKLFVFFPEQRRRGLAASAVSIAKSDNGRFKRIALLMMRSREEMQEWRVSAKSRYWPRGFFLSLDELRKRCAEACLDAYNRICAELKESPITRAIRNGATPYGISAFKARILDNIPIGGGDGVYHKLRFQASMLTGIVPGQFIMIDTAPREELSGVRAVDWSEFRASFQNAPKTFLKRPFGVHRAFYPEFPSDYLTKLHLPRSLATIMHTALPATFDVLYKVLPGGKGTREMQMLRAGATVEILGPLGRRFDIRKMVNDGVREVHVIGGGVGMAPLMFLVQSLRYFNIPVKAFIGIESVSLLRYRETVKPHPGPGDHIEEAYAAGGKDVHIYVDDLKQAGIEGKDIFVSYDKGGNTNLVPPSNQVQGLVSSLYHRYLDKQQLRPPVIAFACGPMPMMKAVYDVAKRFEILLHVFMEKRMACGIGVCLSCVCQTRTTTSGYSRVCKEGPVFEASEIVWP